MAESAIRTAIIMKKVVIELNIQVIPHVNEASAAFFPFKTVAVIDVLRTTSTIAAALAKQAISVMPVETVMEARQMRSLNTILAGERFGRKAAGFELGNSPTEVQQKSVAQKHIVLTTANGTRAIAKARRADYLMAVSLLNISASAETTKLLKRDLVLFCAGNQDHFSIEDGFCAGMLIHRLQNMDLKLELDDLAITMLALYNQHKEAVLDLLLNSKCGKRLKRAGFEEDILFCSVVDRYKQVPLLVDQKFELFSPVQTKFTETELQL